MNPRIDQYLCGEESGDSVILPKHYEMFFDRRRLMLVLVVLTALLCIGGAAAWL